MNSRRWNSNSRGNQGTRGEPGSRPRCFERLDARVVLDARLGCDLVDYPDSEFVKLFEDGTLQFASLRVGLDALPGGGPLDDDVLVNVRDTEVSVGQVKEYLHGFAEAIKGSVLVETMDYRISPWGAGSGSTSRHFEDYIAQQVELPECDGMRFATNVRFELPGVGGEYFTGGWLDLPREGLGTLLRSGDIAEIVTGYKIARGEGRTTLTVHAQLGDLVFTINGDGTLADPFEQIWAPAAAYEFVHPGAADRVLGDIDASGVVDFADFIILSKNFGTQAADGDLDQDGQVSFADFLILSANFGKRP